MEIILSQWFLIKDRLEFEVFQSIILSRNLIYNFVLI